jgi:hypothetical protein
MATKEEKEQLMEVLKFTPRTYRISMWGYGGEKVMGTVDPKVWDYCLKHRIDLVDMAWGDYDEIVEERGLDPDMLPFSPGSWYECDNMAHVNGVSRGSGHIQIEDENGNTVFEKHFDDCNEIEGCPEWSCQDEVWIGQRKKGEVVFIGSSNEKGTFFEGDIELRAPFDIEKLELYYDEVDGDEIVNCVYYDGEEVENYGGSTDGKSSDMDMVRVIDDNGKWERYILPDEDESKEYLEEAAEVLNETFADELASSDKDPLEVVYEYTEWYPKDVKPVRNGEYEVDLGKLVAWPFSRIVRAEWTGKKWQSEDGGKVKIEAWRGLAGDPNEM